MKPLLSLLLLATLLLVPSPALATSAADTVTLDGVTVRVRPGTEQVVTVNHTKGHHARVTFWSRSGQRWEKRFAAGDGRIGYGGLVRAKRRVQGSGRTPLGTFRMPWAFGMHHQKDAWDPSYRKVRTGDYWVLDNQSDHYNRYRNKQQGGFRWRLPASDPNGSERLQDYPVQYEWAVTTSFNSNQVKQRGGAIFLHVNGSGATAGCVSAPRWFLKRLMRRLDQDRKPVIAIGR
ncbi:L,D-transpeptidase family protein [Nocardioides aestuarii]|uniref:L,D-transpeptidase family protein n=1 Tax=Nocardioides aestuarii TaxID=252231 RepID=A0ABW4TI38_9ACTN